MNRKDSLDAAAGCVLVDRNKSYGDPEDNFRTTAQIMTAYLKGRGLLAGDLAPHDVAALMISLKLARLCTSPDKEDTWVDLIGYGACGVECATSHKSGGVGAAPAAPAGLVFPLPDDSWRARVPTVDEIVTNAGWDAV